MTSKSTVSRPRIDRTLFALRPNPWKNQGVAPQISGTVPTTEDGHEFPTRSSGGRIEV